MEREVVVNRMAVCCCFRSVAGCRGPLGLVAASGSIIGIRWVRPAATYPATSRTLMPCRMERQRKRSNGANENNTGSNSSINSLVINSHEVAQATCPMEVPIITNSEVRTSFLVRVTNCTVAVELVARSEIAPADDKFGGVQSSILKVGRLRSIYF